MVGMSLLAILQDSPRYGLSLKNEFEARTGGIWPLNVGQVYTTLGRLARDGLVEFHAPEASEGQKLYALTHEGRRRLDEWFATPAAEGPPSREQFVLKLVMVAHRDRSEAASIIQAERRAAVESLQDYSRLKRTARADGDLGWLFLLDSLVFGTEARIRWLDACEQRLATMPRAETASPPRAKAKAAARHEEVRP